MDLMVEVLATCRLLRALPKKVHGTRSLKCLNRGKSLVIHTQVGQLEGMPEPFARIEKLTPAADRLRADILRLNLPVRGRWAVAVSGGRDSMSLLAMLAEIRARTHWPTSLELEVWHVHHGRAGAPLDPQAHAVAEVAASPNPQVEFRDRAEQLVKTWSNTWGLNFCSFHVEPTRESEEAWREARWAVFQAQQAPVWLAHHREDLLETRLMRLMRGTGPQGLRSMTAWNPESQAVRPVLDWTPEELHAGGEASASALSPVSERLAYLHDPQNFLGQDLRARFRRELWPCLEALRPGATAAMARSFDLIVDALEAGVLENQQTWPQVLSRSRLMLISSAQAERSLYAWLSDRELSISRSQIGEVLKRLAQAEKNFEFAVAGLRWSVRGDDLTCEPIGNRVAKAPISTPISTPSSTSDIAPAGER